ncbi:MAG: peptide deformylase [bacterium]|nr:peptide deformylase [bacterium]
MKLNIICDPDPRLRKKAQEVKINPTVKMIIRQMKDLLLGQTEPEGVGLAAPQIGKSWRIIVLKNPIGQESPPNYDPKTVQTLVNPKIIAQSQELTREYEGCLSVPNLYGQVSRPIAVKVVALNEEGQLQKIKAEGLLARVILHEIDHLEGILFTDKVEGKLLSGEELDKLLEEKVAEKHKVILMGSSQHTLVIAEKIMKEPGLELSLIISQGASSNSLLKQFCLDHNIAYLGIDRFDLEITQKISRIQPDFVISAYFGLKVPPEILALPKFGCLNLHQSLLPKYRGPSPAQAAILNGEKTSGVTIIKMDEGFDTGPILAQEEIPLSLTETTGIFEDRAYLIGGEVMLETIKKTLAGRLTPRPQDSTQATYTKKITKDSGQIDWERQTDEQIERTVRAYTPWPHAWTTIGQIRRRYLGDSYTPKKSDQKRLILISAELNEEKKLVLKTLQIEGKRPISWPGFASGYL